MSTEYPIFFLGVNLRRLMGSLLIIGASCGGGRTFEKPPQRDEKALGEWRRNEAIVMQAVEGLSDPDELLKAVNFFQDLRGCRQNKKIVVCSAESRGARNGQWQGRKTGVDSRGAS